MEFLSGIADEGTKGNTVRLSPGLFQPIAADDVAPIVAEVALAPPRNGIVEIAARNIAPGFSGHGLLRGSHPAGNRKFADSPLEGDGFELPVPRGR